MNSKSKPPPSDTRKSRRHEKSAGAFRTIGEVAEQLGVATSVLRFWESRFSQIKPVTRGGNRRYYRPSDVELLIGIKRSLYEQDLSIKDLQALLRSQGVNAFRQPAQPVQKPVRQSVQHPVPQPVQPPKTATIAPPSLASHRQPSFQPSTQPPIHPSAKEAPADAADLFAWASHPAPARSEPHQISQQNPQQHPQDRAKAAPDMFAKHSKVISALAQIALSPDPRPPQSAFADILHKARLLHHSLSTKQTA